MDPIEKVLIRLHIHNPEDEKNEVKKYSKEELMRILELTLYEAEVDKKFAKALMECVDITFRLPMEYIDSIYFRKVKKGEKHER